MATVKHRVTGLSIACLEFLLCTLEAYFGQTEMDKIGKEVEMTKSKWDDILNEITIKQVQDHLSDYKSDMNMPAISVVARDFYNIIDDLKPTDTIILSFETLLEAL